MKIENIWDLNKMKVRGLRSLAPGKPKLSISMSTCGLALGADDILTAVQKERKKTGLDITLGQTGCMGFCDLEPFGILRWPNKPTLVYRRMTPRRALQILKGIRKNKMPREGLLCMITDPATSPDLPAELKTIPDYKELPIFRKQVRIALKNCGLIEPLKLPEYIASGGYYALYKALYQMSPDDVLGEVEASGLRGRGGAWFSTGLKWRIARGSRGDEKFVLCNADEGDPGAFKDRTIMEGDPFKLLEGMALAGYAIGSQQGVIYLREEYPHTYDLLLKAIGTAKKYGVLGKKILGADFNFNVKIIRGGGAYICGEETALMDSIEGEVGDPRLKPPFPIESGLWDRPTVVNNVETLSNIPMIVQYGGSWYAGFGTDSAKGTKILSVLGKVKYPGLYEVPLGTNLKEVILDMAGGPLEGSQIKAIQVGSPFGNFIPGERMNISLDPETLRQMDSMIGSGVVVVLDQTSCLVDTLLHILQFFVDESCGKCVPCREGVFQMREIILKIYEGRSDAQDLKALSELGEMIKDFALCGLGGGAPSVVLHGIKDFSEDMDAHIRTGKCPWSAQPDERSMSSKN
ncbi:MAG: NADH-ubiquinone oxidoreductase-F iron-sulfur binding region domain-containing protein [Pseudomonadota bacterium]